MARSTPQHPQAPFPLLLAAPLLAAALLAATPRPARAGDGLRVPLILQATSGPACIPGVIVGLDPNNDGFLSVLDAPGGPPYIEIDRLYNGQRVSVCTRRGGWLGVLYTSDPAGCAPPFAWPVTQPYSGPCPHGWISSRYVLTR